MSEWNETCSQAPSNKPEQEPQMACGAIPRYEPIIRERRETPTRVSDLNRMVDKHFGPKTPVDPELDYQLKKNLAAEKTSQILPYLAVGFDKNTPGSLKQLRWAIYEAVDNCHARTSSWELNKRIEDLFKEYTHS